MATESDPYASDPRRVVSSQTFEQPGMTVVKRQMATRIPNAPAAPHPADGLSGPDAYNLALQHVSEGTVQAPVNPNPVNLGGMEIDPVTGQQKTIPATGQAPIPGRPTFPGAATPAAPTAAGTGAALVAQNIAAKKPLIDEQARRSAGVSTADWDKRPGGANDPFSNGFFKSAATPAAPAPVGGTTAVVDPTTSVKGNTRTGGLAAAVEPQAIQNDVAATGSKIFNDSPAGQNASIVARYGATPTVAPAAAQSDGFRAAVIERTNHPNRARFASQPSRSRSCTKL